MSWTLLPTNYMKRDGQTCSPCILYSGGNSLPVSTRYFRYRCDRFFAYSFDIGCGRRIRTSGLEFMRLTSYRCSIPLKILCRCVLSITNHRRGRDCEFSLPTHSAVRESLFWRGSGLVLYPYSRESTSVLLFNV